MTSLPVHTFASLDSTMDGARAIALRSREDAFWVRAHHQTAGRGRSAGVWIDRPGTALLVTMAIRRGGAEDPGDSLPGILALRLAAAVRAATLGYPPASISPGAIAIKWPNDILLEGRKLAGILVEADPRWFFAGIGINVCGSPAVTPGELDAADLDPASLFPSGAGGDEPAPPHPDGLFHHLRREVCRFLHGDEWFSIVDAGLAWRGREVAVEVQGTVRQEGRIQGIARDGALVLEPEQDPVYAGRVRLKLRT